MWVCAVFGPAAQTHSYTEVVVDGFQLSKGTTKNNWYQMRETVGRQSPGGDGVFVFFSWYEMTEIKSWR